MARRFQFALGFRLEVPSDGVLAALFGDGEGWSMLAKDLHHLHPVTNTKAELCGYVRKMSTYDSR